VTLLRASGREMRVGELSESLDWDKSRVSHQLTRMERRGFVKRTQYGADGRRAGMGLTAEGLRCAQSAILRHGGNVRRHFLDPLTPEQASVIRAWSEQAVDRLEPRRSEAAGDGAREIVPHTALTAAADTARASSDRP
jgi:DNA-binding MarR family transcriptional regulator